MLTHKVSYYLQGVLCLYLVSTHSRYIYLISTGGRKVSYYLHSTTHMQHATHLAQMCKIQQINCAIYFEKYLSPYVEERMHYVGLCH